MPGVSLTLTLFGALFAVLPAAMPQVFIVTGAAGCDELHEPFTRPQPARSAFRSNNFGYSQLIVHNHSHLQWQQVGDAGHHAFSLL